MLFVFPLKAQVTIGSEKDPQKFSILELVAANKDGGLRMPQLNNEERDDIQAKFNANAETAEAAKGLWIYNTDTNCLEFWNGKEWIGLCNDILPPPPTLEVNPDALFFAYNESGTGNSKTVTITTNLPSWTWSISGVNAGDFNVIESGNILAISPKTNNNTTALRTATIIVTAGDLSESVTIVQGINATGSGTEINTNNASYVGAFWRANETGERIIRITGVPSTAAGDWTASATWYDSNWNTNGSDGIVFSAENTSDSGVTFNGSEAPGNAETFPVTNGSAFVKGTVAAGGTIQFRMGLQQKFTASANNPARYAVVVITYNNNTKVKKLFIRQGEAPDFLPGQSSGKKWSVYNLGNYNNKAQYGNGGFVTYPTQSGYFYQWGYGTTTANQTPRPYPPTGSTLSPAWSSTSTNALYALGSACPDGYTLPSGGPGGEMRFLPAQASTAWGYYADGFFDRRQVVSYLGLNVAAGTVSAGDNNIAFIGKLFYNSTTNASLFMPAAGCREDLLNGSLRTSLTQTASVQGYYWSSTILTALNQVAYYTLIDVTQVDSYTNYPRRAYGFTVRCVK